LEYTGAADLDPMAQKGYDYATFGSYGAITYAKTASVLLTLEGIIGEDTMAKAMHTYFMKYRFTHPTKEDFLKTIEEVSGQDLRWYFDQAVYGTAVLDYEIRSARSDRLDWYVKDRPKEMKGETAYRSQVVIHRKGDFVFPVDVVIKFDNGDSVTERWDGKDRWVRYTYDKKAKLVSAELDPGTKVLLDKNFFNNSYDEKADTRASRKLLYYWTWLTQVVAQWLAWLA